MYVSLFLTQNWPCSHCSHLVVLDKYHWMLYFLVTAMYPRFLITLDEELNNIPVTVRVGQVYSYINE